MNKLRKTLADLGLHESEIMNIMYAYDIARYAHAEQKRDCGLPYITHPLAGCEFMAHTFSIIDANNYIAFFLHDTGEDTAIFGDREKLPRQEFEYICKNRISQTFNPEVAQLVLYMTKPHIDGIEFKDKAAMMSFYLTRMSKNYKAVQLKMIDRLHNLSTLPKENTAKIARQIVETETVLMPVFDQGIENARLAGNSEFVKSMTQIKQAIIKQLSILK